jgi:hypothetical protein
MMTGRDNRTPMGELGPYDTPREYARPVEEVARALCNANMPKPAYDCDAWDNLLAWCACEDDASGRDSQEERDRFLADAGVAITRLRDLGYINDIGLRAIKAEERK